MAHLTHLYEPGMTYLLTAVTYRRGNFLGKPRYARLAFEDIAFYSRKFQALTPAYVIMPDHIHWIICPSEQNFEQFINDQRLNHGKYAGAPERFYLSKIIEDFKRHTAYGINKIRTTHGIKIWQDGFRDDALRTPDAIQRAIRYVVFNPVKAGLVQKPEDYPFVDWDAGSMNFSRSPGIPMPGRGQQTKETQ